MIDQATPATVLVVDDDESSARFIVDVVRESTGAEAANTRDGSEALQMIRDRLRERGGPYRLVLLDLHGPRLDGLETLRAIRADPAAAAMPVVVFTSLDDPDDAFQAMARGANSYVVKPVDHEAFRSVVLRTVSYWLEIHRGLMDWNGPPGYAT